MSRRRFREHLPFAPRPERDFRWRNRGVSRLEGLSDAVFGFAITLLVVATEVPRTFDALLDAFRQFPAFLVCFVMLMYFWNEHYRFFRRYGLEDFTTRLLNYAILLLVVFSVYPLKFLFTAVFALWIGPAEWQRAIAHRGNDWYTLYCIYGLGLAAIHTAFLALFQHADRRRDALQLSASERVETRASLWEFRINVGVCLTSVLLAALAARLALENFYYALPGIVYASLGPLQFCNGWWHGRQIDALRADRDRALAA